MIVQNTPDRCVAANCSNVGDPSEGIFVHTIPIFGDSRPEAIKRHKKWVDFVKTKRAKWQPTKYSAVCLLHFKPDDYVFLYDLVPTLSKPSVRRLKMDKIGIVVFSTVHAIDVETSLPLSGRTKRRVRIFISAPCCQNETCLIVPHATMIYVVCFFLLKDCTRCSYRNIGA